MGVITASKAEKNQSQTAGMERTMDQALAPAMPGLYSIRQPSAELEFSSSSRAREDVGRFRQMAPARPAPQAGLELMPSSERLKPSAVDDPFTLLEEEKMGSPEFWLTEIEGMIEAGEDVEAARSLEAFRRKYPEYPVPEWQAKLNKN